MVLVLWTRKFNVETKIDDLVWTWLFNLRLWVGSVLSISGGCMVRRSCILAWLELKAWSRDSWLMFWRVVKVAGLLRSMLRVNVALPNGHAELLTLLPSSTVQDVRTKAQQAFGKKYLKLITAKNRVLVNFEQTLKEAEIEDGECLTALVLQPQLAATGGAKAGFALLSQWR